MNCIIITILILILIFFKDTRELFQDNIVTQEKYLKQNTLLPSNIDELNKYEPPLPSIPGCIVKGDGKRYCNLEEVNNTVDTSLRFILDKVNHLFRFVIHMFLY